MKPLLILVGLIGCTVFPFSIRGEPANDFFVDRETLVGTNFTVAADNTNATTEPAEEIGSLDAVWSNTVWYEWTAPTNGVVHAASSSSVSNSYNSIQFYRGNSLTNLSLAKSFPALGLPVAAGETFAIQVASVYYPTSGIGGGVGPFTLDVWLDTTETTPLNDHFNNAPLVSPFGSVANTSVDYATLEPGEPAHLGGAPCKSLWWLYQPSLSGTLTIGGGGSLTGSTVFALYAGPSLDKLTLQAMGTNRLDFDSARGGKLYYIAVAVAPETTGDVRFSCWTMPSAGFGFAPSLPVPGNLLCEPSFEGTALDDLNCWRLSSPNYGGGFVGEDGGVDGATWITVQAGISMWQEFATVPGRHHEVRFAFRPEWGATSGRVRVRWDQQEIGVGECLPGESIYWHWTNLTAMATGEISRVTFEVLEGQLSLDAFSVVPLAAPPDILTQPTSLTTFTNGSASFMVGATGTPPLAYQWFFNQQAIPGEHHFLLSVDDVSASDVGDYSVVVTNAYGAVTSSPVSLAVETPTSPTIVLQPYSDTVAAGGYFAFTIAAVGPPPLNYQWSLNGEVVEGATNSQYQLAPVQSADAGTYLARVWNNTETVWSLPATLKVTTNSSGGGAFWFFNADIPDGGIVKYLPITDADGLTLLSGTNFLAQLYAGPSLALLRPVGQPRPFLTDIDEGLIDPETVVLPTVPLGGVAFLQVRVWEAAKGGTYESSRALGGRFGKSRIFQNGPGLPSNPPPLWWLRSFSLQAGLPQFTTGEIHLLERQPGGIVVWAHEGQPGFRYVIEKSTRGQEWQPYVVITNVTSTATFTDTANSGSAVTFYRSRILD